MKRPSSAPLATSKLSVGTMKEKSERILEVEDLILRRTQSIKEKHKLSPLWEGPYMVTEVIRSGAYRLKDDNDNVLTNTWNIEQLCRFFP